MTLALLDGDIIAYQAACATQSTFDWGDTGGKVLVADPKEAIKAALKKAQDWADAVKAKDIIIGFTGSDKFRTRILPSYKANRSGTEKPAAHAAAVQALKDAFPSHLIPGLEADDVLGILATTDKYHDAVVVTIDKDLLTIPAWHFNPAKDTEPRLVGVREADYRWMSQTLMGDTSDGYKGCPGIGKVKAVQILGGINKPFSIEKLWPRVVRAYQDKKLTEDDALVQARVARILRRSDYDKTTKEVILWHPTSPSRMKIAAVAPVSVETSPTAEAASA